MRKLQSQGVHHITIVGANRQTSIDFWEGVLGMPFVFEQPNLDRPSESHLYFDPGDGRLITIFTNEEREPDPTRTATDAGCVHHIAFSVSRATFNQAVERLDERQISHTGVKDRGFMDSVYFEDPLGLLIELATYRFEPPFGFTHAHVLLEAHKIRTSRGDYNIDQVHLADAIEVLVLRSRGSFPRRRVTSAGYARPVELGPPISYQVLEAGTKVFSSDGAEVGTVVHVLAVEAEDVFDGIVIAESGGHRFADANDVAEIHEDGVLLTLDRDACAGLPEPSANPAVMLDDPAAPATGALSNKLKRAWDLLSGNY
jgi:catechol 2,3-dioxygenase-like lactoylglutathione lyase family enzyme